MQSLRPLSEIRQQLFTGVLSDILDALDRPGQVADLDLIHVLPHARIVGRAQTARAVPLNTVPKDPYKQLLGAIDATAEGRVLVISSPTSSTSSLFGGLLATAVTAAGGEGAIVDGYIRDSEEIRRIGLPTAARGVRPLDSYGRDEVIEVSQPIEVGGVLVHQDDLVFCDEDGLVFVPSAIESEVVERAFEKLEGERSMRAALSDGMRVEAAFAKYGIL